MSVRGDALRLAIYIDAAGLKPACGECRTSEDVVATLAVQFFSLPSEVRRDAKAHGNYIASTGALKDVGRAILADHPLLNEAHASQRRQPRCEHCRKPTWDSFDAAIQFCQVNGAGDLQPFKCPRAANKWHITSRQRL
jgi:hypothetical protein